jgi:hypothetical protein
MAILFFSALFFPRSTGSSLSSWRAPVALQWRSLATAMLLLARGDPAARVLAHGGLSVPMLARNVHVQGKSRLYARQDT